jgi:hypothetical protein
MLETICVSNDKNKRGDTVGQSVNRFATELTVMFLWREFESSLGMPKPAMQEKIMR